MDSSPNSVWEALAPSCWDPEDPLVGLILFWGLFLSIMIFTFLRNKLKAPDVVSRTRPPSSRTLSSYGSLRSLPTILFAMGSGFATLAGVLTSFRASGLDIYYVQLSTDSIVHIAIATVIPIFPIIALHWLCRSGRVGDVVTLLTGLLYAAMAGYILAWSITTGYVPYGETEVDDLLFDFLLLSQYIYSGWVVLYGIAAAIDAWKTESVIWRRQRAIGDASEQPG